MVQSGVTDRVTPLIGKHDAFGVSKTGGCLAKADCADWLVRGAAAWPSNAGNRNGDIGMGMGEGTLRHGCGHFDAHRAMG